jgi:hypothetical protein
MMTSLLKEDIPRELWNNETLYMPGSLVRAYDKILNEYSLMDTALDIKDPGGVIGGSLLEETLEHFARRYGVSSSRVESLVLDPNQVFLSTSECLLNIFSEGKIALLDIACGTGSVGASVLSTYAALRNRNILPKTPTSIHIIGGDCSQHALSIYHKMMNSLAEDLNSAGIESQLDSVEWMAEESYRTSELFDRLFDDNPDADEYLIFIANFSGAMDLHFEEYKNSVQHIFDRTHNKRCAIIWVEPGKSNRGISLFNKLRRISTTTLWQGPQHIGPVDVEYQWFHPFQNRILSCKVLLQFFGRRD